jgi:hypothetical protein
VTPGEGFPTLLEVSIGVSRTPRPDPHFVPFRLPVDVRGAGCVASPFSRLFLTYRIRSLSSSFFIAYRCEYIILLILRLRLNRLRLAILAFTGTTPLRGAAPFSPTSVLEHHPLNGMLADFPFGFSPYPTGSDPLQYIPLRFKSILPLTKGRDARRFGVDLSIN